VLLARSTAVVRASSASLEPSVASRILVGKSVVRNHQAVGTASFPLLQERRAGSIARVPIVAISVCHVNMAAAAQGYHEAQPVAIHPRAW
jgi:hypothetical protein